MKIKFNQACFIWFTNIKKHQVCTDLKAQMHMDEYALLWAQILGTQTLAVIGRFGSELNNKYCSVYNCKGLILICVNKECINNNAKKQI